MLVKTILNNCQRFKSFIYEEAKFIIMKGVKVLEIEIRPRKNGHAICSNCNRKAPLYDHLNYRHFEHIPIWGFKVFFKYLMRRVNCRFCGIKIEKVPWGEGKKELTKTYMHYLSTWAKSLSWKEVAERFQTSWEKVFRSVEYIVNWGRKNISLEGIKSIGVDEVLWHRGHKYLTLVYQIDPGNIRLLWMGKNRTEEAFTKFFDDFLGERRSKLIKHVCSDMWKPYLKVIREKASKAIHILDRFHIVSMMNKAIDKVRAEEYRKMTKEGYIPILKKSRWCLLKRKENLTEKQEIKLKDILQYNLKSVRAYLLKEDFHGFWDYVSPTWADKFLTRWCTRVMRSRIDPMKKVAKTIRNHKDLILNWFKAKKAFSSGIVEGLNNKIKVTMRKSYGFRTFRCTQVALFHTLGKLPEPQQAHRFY